MEGHSSVGAPYTGPTAENGGQILRPGAWAVYAKELPWKVARTGQRIKTKATRRLMMGESQREPMQRSTIQYTGKRMDERVVALAANVESLLIQIPGQGST